MRNDCASQQTRWICVGADLISMPETLPCAHDELFALRIDVKHAAESRCTMAPEWRSIKNSLWQMLNIPEGDDDTAAHNTQVPLHVHGTLTFLS